MIDHLRGPGFFTMAAALSIVGSQFVVMAQAMRLGFMFWFLALFLWIILTYIIFTAFTVKEEKPTLDKGISGAWLLAVVATQSIAVLAALLATHTPQLYCLYLNFPAPSMWLWGGMLYIWMMSPIATFDTAPLGALRRETSRPMLPIFHMGIWSIRWQSDGCLKSRSFTGTW